MKSFSIKALAALVFAAISVSAFAKGNKVSIELNKKEHTAVACGTVGVFKANETFTTDNKELSGYVIKIAGDESIFENLSDDAETCIEGPYRIDSRGFAPHFLMSDVQLVVEDGEEEDDVPTDETLKQAVGRINTEWGDNNISTGVASLKLVKISSTAAGALNKAAATALLKAVKGHGEKLAGTPVGKASGGAFKARKDVAAIVKAVADANAFAPENREARKQIKADVEKVVALLGPVDELKTITYKAAVEGDGPEDDAKGVQVVLIVNTESKEAVEIFTIVGDM